MAGFDEALRTKLLADAGLRATVKTISWDTRPQGGAYPAMVLTLVTPGREYTHAGWDRLDDTRVQIDVWGRDPDVVRGIALALPAVLEAASEGGGWRIAGGFLDSETGEREDVGGQPLFRQRQDWMILNGPMGE